VTALTFLGTGNFLAPGRYWNSFVMDGTVLVEPAPTVLPHMLRCGLTAQGLDVIVISHFHADHTFGWPFLLLELLRNRDSRPLFVVGPPSVDKFLVDMTDLAGIPDVWEAAQRKIDIRYVVVDGEWQQAGALRFRAVEVEHVPHLRCFGYLFDRDGRTVGYSGDTRACQGPDELAGASDVLVLECNGRHPWPTHMHTDAVRELRSRFPTCRSSSPHLGDDVDPAGIADVTVPVDLETLTV
jgi:ribonuclease BN (tRNA processing enzyme)